MSAYQDINALSAAGPVEVSLRFASGECFPGQYLDEESGLHYNYFRDYDPSLGRYVQSDPIGIDGGLNIYVYSNNDPIQQFDISGQSPVHVLLAAGRVVWLVYKNWPCFVYELRDCSDKLVYIGISKIPVKRMYDHKRRGAIAKYGCEDQCPTTMIVKKGFRSRAACRAFEKQQIRRNQPIWNTQHNRDPDKQRKRKEWKEENCPCG